MHPHHTHPGPVGFYATGTPATYLSIHGTVVALAAVFLVMSEGWDLLMHLGPQPCQPDTGCHQLHLVVLGELDHGDLTDILADLDITTDELGV